MPSVLIATEVPAYCRWLSEELGRLRTGKANAIELAAQAYQRLNTIHAFGDGNGRVCQMMMDFVLQCGNLLPASLGGALIDPLPAEKRPGEGTKKLPSKALATVTRGVQSSYDRIGLVAREPAAHAVEPLDWTTETGGAQRMLSEARGLKDRVYQAYVLESSPYLLMLQAELQSFDEGIKRRRADAEKMIKGIEARPAPISEAHRALFAEKREDARRALALLDECRRLYDHALWLRAQFEAQREKKGW
jgi:hypothetical protein